MNNEVNAHSDGHLYIVSPRGYSAYEIAVQNGFEGTEEEWLVSLKGDTGETGPQGKSAYQVAVDNGFEGTEEDFVNQYLNADNYYNKDEIDAKISESFHVFNTVADMLKADLKDGEHAITLGYHALNDDGGAEYLIEEEEIYYVVDNSLLFKLDNGLFAKLMVKETMTPEQFGAYGDNSHNDLDPIQKAVTHCQNVIFGKHYKTVAQITIRKPCRLIGIRNSIISSIISGNLALFKVLSSDVIFDGLKIENNCVTGGTTGEHGSTICFGTYRMTSPLGIKNCVIRNCTITRTGILSYNIGIFGDTQNIVIENNKIYGECVNLHWSGDFNEDEPHTSPCTVTYHPHNIIIKNNILENNRGVFLSAAYDVEISNNTFVSNTYPITLSIGDYGNTLAEDSQKDFIMTGIKIENCNFKEYAYTAISASGYGTRSGDSTHNKNYMTTSKVIVKNCTFSDSTQNPSQAIIGSVLFYGLNVEDCYFKTTTRTNAIYVNPLFDSVIKGCIFDVPGTAITLCGGDNIVIEGCKCSVKSNQNFIKTTQYTFNLTGLTYTVNNLTIRGNNASGGNTIILLDYANNVLIKDNLLLNAATNVNINSNNTKVDLINNTFSDSSSTLVGSHFNVVSNGCNLVTAKNNNFNGSRGIQIKPNTVMARIIDNNMLNNPFNNGLLSVVDDNRTDKKVYLSGNLVDSTAVMIYGTKYSKIEYSENT